MTNANIWNKVEELRASYDTLKVGNLPLDLVSFVVHPIAIETRFDREGIWPSPF